MRKLNAKLLETKADAAVSADVASGKVGGAALRVTQCGKTVYDKRFGFSAEGVPLAENALFRMASMTKPVTALAVLIQIERGLLSLDDPVAKFIHGYEKMDIGKVVDGNPVRTGDAMTAITVLHLLTHTSGIGSGEVGEAQFFALTNEEKSSSRKAAEAFADRYLEFEPFTRQSYSPALAYDVLATLIECTSDMSYPDFVKEFIFDPIGMTDSTFTPTKDEWSRVVDMHSYEGNEKAKFVSFSKTNPFGDYPAGYIFGGAGLVSSMNDYSKFALTLQNGGTTKDGVRVVGEEYIKMMRTPQVPETVMPGSVKWGLGVRVITDDSYGLLPKNSYGWSGAFGTHFWVDPENQITAVYLKNSLYDGGAGALTAARFERDVTGSLE